MCIASKTVLQPGRDEEGHENSIGGSGGVGARVLPARSRSLCILDTGVACAQ